MNTELTRWRQEHRGSAEFTLQHGRHSSSALIGKCLLPKLTGFYVVTISCCTVVCKVCVLSLCFHVQTVKQCSVFQSDWRQLASIRGTTHSHCMFSPVK